MLPNMHLRIHVPGCASPGQSVALPLRPVRKPVGGGNDTDGSPNAKGRKAFRQYGTKVFPATGRLGGGMKAGWSHQRVVNRNGGSLQFQGPQPNPAGGEVGGGWLSIVWTPPRAVPAWVPVASCKTVL